MKNEAKGCNLSEKTILSSGIKKMGKPTYLDEIDLLRTQVLNVKKLKKSGQ